MKRAAQKHLTDAPKSGDSLVDWMFGQCVVALRSQRVRISRKKRLVDPGDPRRVVIRGLMDPDIHPSGNWVQILINPAKNTHSNRNEEVETLIHEVAHLMLPRASERSVLRLENMLSRRFSVAQRRYLKSFIPKHEVKRYPRAIIVDRIATA